MSTSNDQANSERLKAEGNALFIKNDFAGAYQKYTEAIKYDDKNAILYSNRAACAFGLNRCMDSSADATKATKLDPTYAKAWSRLAQAETSLNNPERAIKAWKRAIAALPVENLTPAQKKQRENYTAELATAQAKLADLEANPREPKDAVKISGQSQLPWTRAKALIPELRAAGHGLRQLLPWDAADYGLAWVISQAYQEWQEAIEHMKIGRIVQNPGTGRSSYVGHLGVLVGLTNAMIADDRVFHIADANFFEVCNNQIMFEKAQSRAWRDSGAREIMELIPERLRTEGWDSVHRAISITVRAWIMRGFMEDKLRDDLEVALEFYTSALDLLQWGKERWKDVSFDDKDIVFQPTFIRGVKCMRLEAFLAAYNKNPGENSKFPLKEVLAGADDILTELEGVPEQPGPNTDDIAFYLSFFRYPAGQAHAARGFYYHHTGILRREKEGVSEDLMLHYFKASQEYLKASSYYPVDDEKHAWYLHVAFSVQFEVGGRVDVLLMLADKLRDAIPHMKPIWGSGAYAKSGAHDAFVTDMEEREELLRMVEGKSAEERSRMGIRPRGLRRDRIQ